MDNFKYKLLRIIIIAGITTIIFTQVLIPFQILGSGLEPNLKNGSWHLILKPAYLVFKPKVNDYVGIKLAGNSVILTAQIGALPGDVIKVSDEQIELPSGRKINISRKYPGSELKLNDTQYFVHAASDENKNKSSITGIIDYDRIIGKLIW